MIVGCLRRNEKPGHVSKVLAVMSKYHDLDLVFFNPSGITIGSNKIAGKMLVNDKWIDVEVDLPDFIDVKSTLFTHRRYKNKLKYLLNNTNLSVDKRLPLPKNKLNEVFKNDPEIEMYLIPSIEIIKFIDIENFITIHKSIVLKPVRSNGGRSVYLVSKQDSNYVIQTNKDQKILSQKEFKTLYKEKFKDRAVLAQKYIISRDAENNPIDCRVHVEKNVNGEWSNVKNIVRIGVGQKVISNINQGGGMIDAKQFLKIKYGDNWKGVYKSIRYLAKNLPYKVEKVLGKEYMTLGFDIGMDEEGYLYLFEVNDCPIVTPLISEMAMARTGYYKYILNRINNN